MTACASYDTKYLYLKPYVATYDTTAKKELDEGNNCRHSDLFFTVIMPMDQYREAAVIPFVNKAYATSVPEPRDIALEKLTSISIHTVQPYNAAFPAGADITGNCIFRRDTYSPADSVYGSNKREMDAGELIRDLSQSGYFYSYYRQYYESATSFSFSLKEPPAGSGLQQFIISFETEHHSRIIDTTISFTLEP